MQCRWLHSFRHWLYCERTWMASVFWMVVCRRRGGLRDPDLVKEVQMVNRKILPYLAAMSFVLGVVIFVVVASLVRVHVSQAFALSLGGFAMLLVGFPFTRYVSDTQLSFKKW